MGPKQLRWAPNGPPKKKGPLWGPFWGPFYLFGALGIHLGPFGVNLGPISRPKTRALPSKMHILEINSPILEHNLRDPGGRLFRDADPGGPEVVVWPDALWRDYYCVHAR